MQAQDTNIEILHCAEEDLRYKKTAQLIATPLDFLCVVASSFSQYEYYSSFITVYIFALQIFPVW